MRTDFIRTGTGDCYVTVQLVGVTSNFFSLWCLSIRKRQQQADSESFLGLPSSQPQLILNSRADSDSSSSSHFISTSQRKIIKPATSNVSPPAPDSASDDVFSLNAKDLFYVINYILSMFYFMQKFQHFFSRAFVLFCAIRKALIVKPLRLSSLSTLVLDVLLHK